MFVAILAHVSPGAEGFWFSNLRRRALGGNLGALGGLGPSFRGARPSPGLQKFRKRFRVWSIGRNFQMRCCCLCDCVCYMLVHGSHNALRFICHHTFWSLLNPRHLCPLSCVIQSSKNQGPPPTKTFACLLLHSHDPFIEFPQGLVRPTKNAFAWSRVKPPLGSVQIGAQDACTWGFQLVPKSL